MEDINELMRVETQLLGVEVCLCKAFELVRKEDFRSVKKREIIQPVDLSVQMVKGLILTNDLKKFIDRTSL